MKKRKETTISDYVWTLTLVHVGWCNGGNHGDAVHVETASLDRNCRCACAEIYNVKKKRYSFALSKKNPRIPEFTCRRSVIPGCIYLSNRQEKKNVSGET